MHKHALVLFFVLIPVISLFPNVSHGNPGNPVEVGLVKWGRDLDKALLLSESSGKPVFLLFQEVPGCVGCRNFGSEVLSHRLLVEAIQDEFHPVVIFNNRSQGMDNAVRERFEEPSWNYQVVRFLNKNGEDIIPRKEGVWTIGGIALRMAESLNKVGREVPAYLQSVILENTEMRHGRAALSMACFWTGEYHLGKINGVIKTEAGWYDNREVVLLTYHKDLVSLQRLAEEAADVKCAQKIYVAEKAKLDKSRFAVGKLKIHQYKKAKSSDQKRQLQQWDGILAKDDLTGMQLMKLNSWLLDNRELALKYLSPQQRRDIELIIN